MEFWEPGIGIKVQHFLKNKINKCYLSSSCGEVGCLRPLDQTQIIGIAPMVWNFFFVYFIQILIYSFGLIRKIIGDLINLLKNITDEIIALNPLFWNLNIY